MYAGRQPIGSVNPIIVSKDGPFLVEQFNSSREVLACGLACSEIFHSSKLVKVLTPSHDLEALSLSQLSANLPTKPLSLHTSAGVLPELQLFLDTLAEHLPPAFRSQDAITSLQITGQDAVWAGVDLLLQLQKIRKFPDMNKVAVSDSSYHGPAASAFGSTTAPFGNEVKTPIQRVFRSPSFQNRFPSESTDKFNARIFDEFQTFLDQNSDIGVLLIEPQSGSSNCGQPWDLPLLHNFISEANKRGIFTLADEIMCGLARHGHVTTFLSQAWDLNVDAITFGKAIATGVEAFAGATLKAGAAEFQRAGRTVHQSHTYAGGSSARALTTARAVLTELSRKDFEIGKRVQYLWKNVVLPIFVTIKKASDGCLDFHGQGLMFGGYFKPSPLYTPQRALKIFRVCCAEERVLPYFVERRGGWMFTPVLDVTEEVLEEAGRRLTAAVKKTGDRLRLLAPPPQPQPQPQPQLPVVRERFKGPSQNEMDEKQLAIYNDIKKTRSTGVSGPFGPWLANASIANYAQQLGRTCRNELVNFSLKTSELIILVVAAKTKAEAEWSIHEGEARKAGVSELVIDEIKSTWGGGTKVRREVFGCEKTANAYNFAEELCRTTAVSDENYWKLQKDVGDAGVVELVALVGYYNFVSMTLNTFQIMHKE